VFQTGFFNGPKMVFVWSQRVFDWSKKKVTGVVVSDLAKHHVGTVFDSRIGLLLI
jgi:hypothetical protein